METTTAFIAFQSGLKELKTFFHNQEAHLEETITYQKVKTFEKILEKLRNAVIELDAICIGECQTFFADAKQRLKKVSAELRKIAKNETATIEELVRLAKGFFLFAGRVNDLNMEYKDFVHSGCFEEIGNDILRPIFQKIKADQDIFVLDPFMGFGNRLSAFEQEVQAPRVYTFGIEADVDLGKKAFSLGKVYKVAKGSLHRMTPRIFDVLLFFRNDIVFSPHEQLLFRELLLRDFLFQRKPLKNNGLVIFNVPYYRIPRHEKTFANLKIERIYRVGDQAGNLIFICSKKKPNELAQKKELRKAFMMPETIPLYSEAELLEYENGNQVTDLEKITFRGTFIDVQDHDLAFKNEMNPAEFIESLFEPEEKIIELSRPLQEYKLGHLAAIAATGITDGIYEGVYPHILSTKIIRKNVVSKTEDTVVKKGGTVETVPIISVKKSSELIMAARTPDGRVTNLLTKTIRIAETEEKGD